MSPTVDYLSDMESSFDVPSISVDKIVDFYSSEPYRTPGINTPDKTTAWPTHGYSMAYQEPQSGGIHVIEYQSSNIELLLSERQHDENPPFYCKPGSSTYASQIRRFANLKDNLSATSRNPCAEILKEINPRVVYLSEVALEEEEQKPLSSDSYLGLVNILNRIYDLNPVPVLALTYEGNIVAEWRRSPDEKLVLQFLDSFNLKFVFFYTDSYNPTKILRISGNGSALSFFEDHPRTLSFLKEFSD